MKIITTTFSKNNDIYIHSYGYENVSENAHWGKGCRDVYILHYVLSGEGFFNGRKVKAGEGFFITPKQIHQYHSSKDKPWEYFWMTFNGNIAKDICIKHICIYENCIFEFNFKLELLGLSDKILAEESPISNTRALGYFFLLISYHEKKDEVCGNYYVHEAKLHSISKLTQLQHTKKRRTTLQLHEYKYKNLSLDALQDTTKKRTQLTTSLLLQYLA